MVEDAGCCFCEGYGDNRDRHVLTHSCPTRRSSELRVRSLPTPANAGHTGLRNDVAAGTHASGIGDGSTYWSSLGGSRAVIPAGLDRSEEHTSELQSLMRISYAVFCLKKKITTHHNITHIRTQDYMYQT